jgi:thiosulfate/3-mercaptopyruvate sulfurtransferase
VLDGGLRRWKALDLPLVSGAPEAAVARRFEAGFRPELVCSIGQMRDLLGAPQVAIVDARSPGRFAGSEPEPRPGVRSGHIPGSRNVPYRSLVDETSGEMKTPSEIAATFETAGTDVAGAVVTTCGTGVTAAILALGLFRLGRSDVAVYDGSWTEWGGRADTPIA